MKSLYVTIVDVGGLGQSKIKCQTLGEFRGDGNKAWKAVLADNNVVVLKLQEDARSSTGNKLAITQEGDSANSIKCRQQRRRWAASIRPVSAMVAKNEGVCA